MNSLVEWLLRPNTYSDSSSSVELVETHISFVFLTARFAYKLKKPVRFDFLDFSTIEARRIACEAEVRLNRRLASAVYLGTVAVRCDEKGELFLDESSGNRPDRLIETDVVDWLVKMQRLPADRTLAELSHQARLPEAAFKQLAARLAAFYRSVSPVSISPPAYRSEIERHIRANRSVLLEASSDATSEGSAMVSSAIVRRTHVAQLQTLALRPLLFDARVSTGRVVDGHGDLRAEHIYLLPEPVIIDCIEFNPELRRLDIADELSFLASDCDFRAMGDVGHQIVQSCLDELDDHPSVELMAFYRCYRACVRAKVAVLRSQQVAAVDRDRLLNEASEHLEWADRYVGEMGSTTRPLLFVVHGLMGSGKSTLAMALSEQIGATHVQTDAIRRQMFGPSQAPAAYGEGRYHPNARQAVYSRMFEMAVEELGERISVVLDGTFVSHKLRRQATDSATCHGARPFIIHCACPKEVALQRLAQRAAMGSDPSEARPELYDLQRAEENASSPDLESIAVDTTAPLAAQVRAVLDSPQFKSFW
jgi:hypothetical protein